MKGPILSEIVALPLNYDANQGNIHQKISLMIYIQSYKRTNACHAVVLGMLQSGLGTDREIQIFILDCYLCLCGALLGAMSLMPEIEVFDSLGVIYYIPTGKRGRSSTHKSLA